MTGHNHGRTSRKSGWKAVREYRISTRRTMVTLGIWMGLGSDLDGAWKVDPNALPTIVSRDLPKSFGTAIFAVGCFIGTTLWLPTENIPMNQLDLQKGLSGEGAFSVGCWNLSQTTLQHDRFTALGSFTWTLQIRLCIVQKILNVRHVVFGQILSVVSGARGIPRSWNFIAPRALWSGQRRTMATNGNGAGQQILSGTKGGILIKKKQEEEFAAWVWICNASTTWSLRDVWSISELASLLFRRRVYVQEQKGVDPNLNLKGLRQHMLAISRMRLLSASASAKVWPWFVECLNSWQVQR